MSMSPFELAKKSGALWANQTYFSEDSCERKSLGLDNDVTNLLIRLSDEDFRPLGKATAQRSLCRSMSGRSTRRPVSWLSHKRNVFCRSHISSGRNLMHAGRFTSSRSHLEAPPRRSGFAGTHRWRKTDS